MDHIWSLFAGEHECIEYRRTGVEATKDFVSTESIKALGVDVTLNLIDSRYTTGIKGLFWQSDVNDEEEKADETEDTEWA